MNKSDLVAAIEVRFLKELRHHLQGWQGKVSGDLSDAAFKEELAKLQSDPVYRAFGLATPEYALVRLMGRLSISIGRRLGEIYDKIPRFIAQGRFNLSAASVAPKFDGLELDVCVPLSLLSKDDSDHVHNVVNNHLSGASIGCGPAIEIRYNFNPNDSARLRKDVHMAELLSAEGFLPVYLIFCTISPREEAIARLKRAGWTFLIGKEAAVFMDDLIGMDIETILASEVISTEVKAEMQKVMTIVYGSRSMSETVAPYLPQIR